MIVDNNSSSSGVPTVSVLVRRGDELPKKNYETKLHPTYETMITLKGEKTGKIIGSIHEVVKFFDDYYEFYNALTELGVDIPEDFPPKLKKTGYGLKLSEEELQLRCYMLNKWMNAVIKQYPIFPTKAQIIMSKFLSLDNQDESKEKNKDLILSTLRKLGDTNAISLPNQSRLTVMDTTSRSDTIVDGVVAPVPLTAGSLNTVSTAQTSASAVGKRSTVASMLSTPTVMDNINQYVEEKVINKYLGVSILMGEMVQKDNKDHYSYEVQLRMLSLPEIASDHNSKREIDFHLYEEQRLQYQINVNKLFGEYRELKEDLKLVHVYSNDSVNEANDARVNGYKIIIIDTSFPPTMSKSTLGIKLKESELSQRASLLNNWLGLLLTAFPVIPRDGQNLILNFLTIATNANTEYGSSSGPILDNVIVALLKGTYIPPKVAVVSTNDAIDKRTSSSSFFGFGKNNKKQQDPTLPPLPSSSSSAAAAATTTTTTVATLSLPIPPHSSQAQLPSHTIPISASSSSPPPPTTTSTSTSTAPQSLQIDDNFVYDDDDDEEGREIQVGSFLSVVITAGPLLAKKTNDKHSAKTHPSYEISIRILPISEVFTPDRDKYDPVAYEDYLRHGPMRIAKTFNDYRDLKLALETFNVFSLEQKNAATELALRYSNSSSNRYSSNRNSSSGGGGSSSPRRVIVVESPFPRTYKRSTLGIPLTDLMLKHRTIQLNKWFGALLKVYANLPIEAQKLILRLMEASPIESNQQESCLSYGEGLRLGVVKRDDAIVDMLLGKFIPTFKPEMTTINLDDDGDRGGVASRNQHGRSPEMDKDFKSGCACVVM